MSKPPQFRPEIDHHTLKLIVGLIALGLANLTAFLSGQPLPSISDAYHVDGWARDVFVGALVAIAAFLAAYNGHSRLEEGLSKLAALAALGVAFFPCECGGRPEIIPKVHGLSAALMFGVLAALCWIFYGRARAKPARQAHWRAWIYAACGVAIVAAILVLGYDGLTGGSLKAQWPRLTFYGERVGLVAFGISWLVASRVLPLITAPQERISLLGPAKPRQALLLQPGEGRAYAMGALDAVFKADGAESAERYSISEWWLQPHTQGPGAHAHAEDDVFYVLAGRVSFLMGDRWQDVGPGGFVLVPGGVTHDFQNRSDERAGLLNLSMPGGFEVHMPDIVAWFRQHPPGPA